jgi:hypothetical protein
MQDDLEARIQRELTAFDEILVREDTRPISSIDIAGMHGAISMWRSDGVRVAMAAAMWYVLPYTDDEKKELLHFALVAGWFPIYVGDNQTEYRIVKSCKGRKFWGGEKVVYRVYEMTPNINFTFISEHNSINMAAWALHKQFNQ